MSFFKNENEDVKMLNDTLEYFTKKDSDKAYESADVYLPDEVDKICAQGGDKNVNESGNRCAFSVINEDSFTAARRLAAESGERVLVLNFANPVNPGGGVRHGARAQEEDLCRKSSLLLSLESEEASRYYKYNKSLNTYLGSDAIIISPDVEIIKDENGNMLEKGVRVAVMTCAAPMITYGIEDLTHEQYTEMLYNRIVKMLKIAAYLGYRDFVLGAWGCGAFRNDAKLVSDLFYKVFKETDFNGVNAVQLFDRIEFAVLSRGGRYYNFDEFKRNFEEFYID